MARAAGIANAHTIGDIEDFKKKGVAALSRSELAFLVCKVEESLLHREIPRPNTDLAENKFDAAARHIATGLRLGKDVGEGATLIQMLVGYGRDFTPTLRQQIVAPQIGACRTCLRPGTK